MPNAKILKEKQKLVDDLADKLQTAKSGVLVDYRGLTVEQDTQLRNKLRDGGVDYKVVKNTLTRFAAERVGFSELDEILNGPTSLALSFDDLIAPAKILCDFAKGNDKLEVKAGFVEGKIITANEVKALAELPPKDQLIAMVLRGFNGPISGFANVLNANLRGLAIVINAIAEKKTAEGNA